MGWVDSFTVAVLVSIGALAFIVGLLRRESRSVIALNTIGVVIFFFAIRWTTHVGEEAFGPMAAASLGAILFTMGSERSRIARATAPQV
jgi:uncharacterized membrane protein